MKEMNNATFIYILASCVLIVAFVYADHAQNSPTTEAREEVVSASDFGAEEPITEEVAFEEVSVMPQPPQYVLTDHRPKTYEELEKDLERIPNPPYPFKLNEYDCSQMSAFMEYQLEAKGYDTTISGSITRGHAWVTVHNIIDRDRVDIECIPPVYVKSVHHEIEVSYKNITEALNGPYLEEWNWWVPGGQYERSKEQKTSCNEKRSNRMDKLILW